MAGKDCSPPIHPFRAKPCPVIFAESGCVQTLREGLCLTVYAHHKTLIFSGLAIGLAERTRESVKLGLSPPPTGLSVARRVIQARRSQAPNAAKKLDFEKGAAYALLKTATQTGRVLGAIIHTVSYTLRLIRHRRPGF